MEKKSSTFDKITDERNIKRSFKASSYPYLYLPVVILIHLLSCSSPDVVKNF